MSDWHLSPGAERPMWEPVRFVDFAGERLEALRWLRQRLRESPLENLSDEELAMHAILEYMFSRGTVRLEDAKAEAIRLANARLPDPGSGRRRRLLARQRDDMLITVGVVWGRFTSHNFPLEPQNGN